MHNLRLLKIYDSSGSKKCKVYLQNGLCYLPRSIRYLKWDRCPLKTLPPNFKPKNLVELKMPYGQLEQLWDGVQDLSKLRGIDLRNSIHLTQIPDLSCAPNLERIILEKCTSLCQDSLRSLQSLTKLTHVNLNYCSNLHSVLDKMFEMAPLRTCTLRGFSNVNTIPMTIPASLVSLDLSLTAIEYLPSSIGSLKNLCELQLNRCKRLANLPSNMNELDSLVDLGLSGCSILQKLPKLPIRIGILDVSGTAIKELSSSSVEGCFRLALIKMTDCESLECLPSNIFTLRSLKYLNLDGCSKLKKLHEILEPMKSLESLCLRSTGIGQLPSSIGNIIKPQECHIDVCEKLGSSLDFFPIPSVLELLDLSNCTIIEIPESIIKGISVLRRLYIKDCKNLRSLPELPLGLEFVDALGCVSLEVVLNSRRALTREFWIDSHNTWNTCEYLGFCDCMKLDEEERDNILIDFKLRVLRRAMQSMHAKDQWNMHAIGACYPGNEIPKWFEYQDEGPTISIKLPRQWNNSNFLGFVVCAVGGDSNPDADELICKFNLKSNQSKIPCFEWKFNHESMSNSSHLYMWFEARSYHDCLDAEEASFHFSFKESNLKMLGSIRLRFDRVESSKCQVKKCGVHILYCQDLEEFGLNFVNDRLPNSKFGFENSNMDLDELDSDVILNTNDDSDTESNGASRNDDSDTESSGDSDTKSSGASRNDNFDTESSDVSRNIDSDIEEPQPKRIKF